MPFLILEAPNTSRYMVFEKSMSTAEASAQTLIRITLGDVIPVCRRSTD